MIERAACIWVRGFRACCVWVCAGCQEVGQQPHQLQSHQTAVLCSVCGRAFLYFFLPRFFLSLLFIFYSWSANQTDSLGLFGIFGTRTHSQWSISVWEHSALYCDFQVLLAVDPAVTTVHPCCVCLFCAHRMCWRMMRTLAMPTAPSLMKVGPDLGEWERSFFM